jgi:TPR repeat protein
MFALPRTFPFEALQESGTGRRPALSPLVYGQQLSGTANFTAYTCRDREVKWKSQSTGTIMSRERILEAVLTIFGAVLLLVAAVGKHPYGFYMVLRLVVTVGAVYWAWRVYKTGQRAWTWIFVAVALLLNPFLPIRMQRAQWQPIDLCLGILLIAWSGYWLFRKQTRASQRQTRISSQDGQAFQWPRTETSKETGSSAGGTGASIGGSAAGQRGTSSAKGSETETGWTLYRIVWTAVCLILGAGFSLAVSSLDAIWVWITVWVMIFAGLQAFCTDSTLYRIAWMAVCLILGAGFSLAVSAPDSGLGLIVVSAIAFGGFLCAAMLRSRGISKVLSKIGITTFARQATVIGCLIVLAILALNFVGSLVARSSAPLPPLGNSVSGTSAPPVQNLNNATDANKRIVTKAVSGASAGCHPQVFSQQELSALKWQATNGDAEAQCVLGDSYYEGKGVPQDYTQAAFWWHKAAEQGLANAQYNLGAWYEEGENQGVPQDDTQVAFWRRKIRAWRAYINSVDFHNSKHWRFTQAAFWYRKAAEQGDVDAQYNLGSLYYDGRGVPHDYAQAVLWFRKAAERGDSDAQDELGDLYLSGEGVAQNYTQAAMWYRKAAEQGNALAQASLGDLYRDGQGVPRDYAEAYFWYDLAAAGEQEASDSKQVAKDRDEAASHLTPADLFRAQGRAVKWFEDHPAKPQ